MKTKMNGELIIKLHIEDMKKYASRTSILSKDMVEESKRLIQALGLPIIQAPSEGEADGSSSGRSISR